VQGPPARGRSSISSACALPTYESGTAVYVHSLAGNRGLGPAGSNSTAEALKPLPNTEASSGGADPCQQAARWSPAPIQGRSFGRSHALVPHDRGRPTPPT